MSLTLPRLQDRSLVPRPAPTWASLFAWFLCSLAVAHAWLLPTITDPRNSSALAIQLLQPLAAFGAIGLMLVAAWRYGPGSRRQAWSLHALAILTSMAADLILLASRAQGIAGATSVTNALYLLAYLCAVIGTTLYLPLRTWWGGGTLRLLLDGAVINAAAFVILQYALPWLIRPWTSQMSAQVTWLALDIGVVFIVGVLSLRYGRRGGPLLALVFPSVLCLLIGDSLLLAVSGLPGGSAWAFAPGPLYTLHRVLLALGAYRGVARPPEAPPASSTAMPTAEWFLWTIVPRGMALAALLIGVSAPMPVGVSLLALVAVLIAREALVVIDHRGATVALHLARETAQRTAIQTQDFLARIIHDVAAPTHGLRGATDRLGQMERGQDACAADSVRMIRLHMQHMEHLVTQLRLYQQALAVAQPVLISIDLAPICAVAVDAIQDRAESRGVTVRLVLEPGADRVRADTAVLRRVLDNLLSNALVATPSGGEIVLSSAARDAAATMIMVTDSGCGIPVEHQERIFAPLVRLQAGGMGLGLTIARELVSVMGGTLSLVSQVGRGSTFTIQLPRGDAAQRESTKSEA